VTSSLTDGVFCFLIYLSNMKKIIRINENDLRKIVKKVIVEEEISDVIELSKCYNENGSEVPCEEDKITNKSLVKTIRIKLKKGPKNPFEISSIEYNSNTGEIKNGINHSYITTIEKNLNLVELAKWLRKKRLIKIKQLRNIKKS
jgi:hypothetical protein